MELDSAIFQRRSIRKFSEEYVQDADIKKMLEAARWAPSWGNSQPWEFIILRDRKLIVQITDLYSERNPARACSANCNAMLVVCAKMGASGHKKGVGLTKFKEWFMFDLGMAAQNISLVAHELGLGSVIVGHLDHEKAHEILALPSNFEVVATLPLGVPAEDEKNKTPPPRRALSEMVHLNRFGEKWGPEK